MMAAVTGSFNFYFLNYYFPVELLETESTCYLLGLRVMRRH